MSKRNDKTGRRSSLLLAEQDKVTYPPAFSEKAVDFYVDEVLAAGIDVLSGPDGALNAIAEAEGLEGRLGRHVTVRSVAIQGKITCPFNASLVQRLRLVLYCDTLGSGNGTSTLIFDDNPPSPGLLLNQFRDLNYSDRFKVYYDKTFDLHSPGGTVADPFPLVRSFKIYKKLKLGVEYKRMDSSYLAIQTNGLQLVAYSDITNGANIELTTRVRFVDV